MGERALTSAGVQPHHRQPRCRAGLRAVESRLVPYHNRHLQHICQEQESIDTYALARPMFMTPVKNSCARWRQPRQALR
jgi:hypothetical protein